MLETVTTAPQTNRSRRTVQGERSSKVSSMASQKHAGLTLVAASVIAALLGGNAFADEALAPATAAAIAPKPAPARQLDLRPPNITHLFTSEQLNRILTATLREDLEEVEVEGARERLPTSTPEVWSGIASLGWAVVNPTQAWRIFLPLPPDQTRDMQDVRFDATYDYVLEPAGVSSPHAP